MREDQGQGKHKIEGNRVDNRVEEDIGVIKRLCLSFNE